MSNRSSLNFGIYELELAKAMQVKTERNALDDHTGCGENLASDASRLIIRTAN
jgi:hypothetical protein